MVCVVSPLEQRYEKIEVVDAGQMPEKNAEMLMKMLSVIVLRKLKADAKGKKERRNRCKIVLIRPKHKPNAKRFVHRRYNKLANLCIR